MSLPAGAGRINANTISPTSLACPLGGHDLPFGPAFRAAWFSGRFPQYRDSSEEKHDLGDRCRSAVAEPGHRVERLQLARDCVCLEAIPAMTMQAADGAAAFSETVAPALRWESTTKCRAEGATTRLSASEGLHWFSGATISFARGLNDTPKIVATLLVIPAFWANEAYGLVAGAIAVGAIAGARRVARMLSHQTTPMELAEAVTANPVAAGLVGPASFWALPVSTTHVTSGGLFGIGWIRREGANWKRVREIVWSWIGTLPMGAAIATALYWGFAR